MSNFPIKEIEIGMDSFFGIGEKAYFAGKYDNVSLSIISMKIVTIIIICLLSIQCFSQKVDDLFTKRSLHEDFNIQVKNDSGIIDVFPTNYIAIITFKSDSASVYYFVFNYQQTDSINLRTAEFEYSMVSGCNIVPNKYLDKNFYSFIYGKYFFLLQHCACRTGVNENCAKLAFRINQWIREN